VFAWRTHVLSTAALTRLRAVADTFLPDTAVVSRPTGSVTLDEAGGETAAYADVLTGVSCKIRPATGDERLVAAATTPVADVVLHFPALTDVRATDVVTVLHTETGVVRVLQVLPPVGPKSFEGLRRVNTQEVA
jgi:hypothetical protein